MAIYMMSDKWVLMRSCNFSLNMRSSIYVRFKLHSPVWMGSRVKYCPLTQWGFELRNLYFAVRSLSHWATMLARCFKVIYYHKHWLTICNVLGPMKPIGWMWMGCKDINRWFGVMSNLSLNDGCYGSKGQLCGSLMFFDQRVS